MILLRTLAELSGGQVFSHTFAPDELDMHVAACAPSFTVYSPEARFQVLVFMNAYPKNPPKKWLPRGDLMSFVLSGHGANVALETFTDSTPLNTGNGKILRFEVTSDRALLQTDTATLRVSKPSLLVASVSPILGSNTGLTSIGKTLGRISIYLQPG